MRKRAVGWCALGVAAVLVAVSACSASQSSDRGKGNDKVEVFSWWSGPGEEEGFHALIDDFNARHPGVEFVNATVAGGAGSNAKLVLDTRLQSNDPPDSYQAHAGRELANDVRAGRLQDLNHLFDQQGWRDKFPKGLLDAITMDGKVYSVPVNIHRANLLWYSPRTLAKVGITAPPESWTDFRIQAERFKTAGITPIAVGPVWAQKQLLETILLGELGAQAYIGLWDGTTDWNAPQVMAALLTAAMVFDYSDVKTAASDWQGAMAKTVESKEEGGAAYTVMVDWAYAQNLRKGLKFKTDFDVALTPGSYGVYDFLSDSFTLPKGAPHPAAAEKWLIECGSVEGQDLFNPIKGSVPARVDTDKSKYTEYLATSLADWQDPGMKIVGSLAHGAVVSAEFNAAIDAALTTFIEDHDKENFAKAMIWAYENAK